MSVRSLVYFIGLTLAGCTGATHPDTGERTPGELESAAPPHAHGHVDPSWCEVERILATHCVACHKEGGVGPMPLVTQADLTRPSTSHPGATIYERVAARIHDTRSPMPPQGMLDAAALAVLDSWIAAGAPAGGDCDAQPPVPAPTFDDTECDAIYQVRMHAPGDEDAPFVIPAGGELHPKVTFDAPWGDREVQAIGFRPITDNERVLHHWILNARDGTFLTGWAPGGNASPPLESDVGMYMPRGTSSIYLDMHYYNVGSSEVALDRSGVEICVLEQPHFRPKLASVSTRFASFGGPDFILAPAHSENHEEVGTCRVRTTVPVRLLSVTPHAHKYAVHMKFMVQKTDGSEIVLHDRPFNFHAQGSYAVPGQVFVETGDIVRTICTYTNPTSTDVAVGESSDDEMCFNFAVYYPMGALSCGNGSTLRL